MPNAEFLFVGAKDKMEMEKVPQAGYKIQGLDIAGFNRSSLIKNISLPRKLIQSFFQVRRILKEFKPDAVIGVGGYSSYPVLKMAQQKGIPTFIHESNAFAGKSNILLGKNCTKIFVATAGMDKFFPSKNIIVTGNPVRKTIADMQVSRKEALAFFGLEENKTTILSIGGSLGANSINISVEAGLNELNANNIQLIWQTGKPFVAQAKLAVNEMKNVWANDFIKQMEMAYAAADVIISRSGAMSVAEICLAKKPVVFVPYPFAAEDHQTFNAKTLVDKNAALMITDAETKDKLMNTVFDLAKDKIKQETLKTNIAAYGIKSADEKIANEIIKQLSMKRE